jgi:alcohol dehydrogenase (cytochrome c)
MNIAMHIARFSRLARHIRLCINVVLAGVTLPLVAMAAPSAGDYTREQAQIGAQIYSGTCSVCHGSKLQGGAAPALTGPGFAQSINVTYSTASALFTLISTQMPVNNPGALSKKQYTQVLAFILAKNGYPAGSEPLDAAHLDQVALLPYPNQDSKSAPDANLEIANIGSANRLLVGAPPEKGRVTISDVMMGSVDSHPADWLLHGRDYSNQRFSPLKDINAGNVSSLAPVALVQTGITSSFETTPIVVNGVMYATTPAVDNRMKILAIRAHSGEIIWESTYTLGDFKICCGPVNRGAAVGYGNVYVVTLDDRLIALDAASGEVRWNVAVADPAIGYSETMAPQIYKGKIIVGSAGGEWPIRGFVASSTSPSLRVATSKWDFRTAIRLRFSSW